MNINGQWTKSKKPEPKEHSTNKLDDFFETIFVKASGNEPISLNSIRTSFEIATSFVPDPASKLFKGKEPELASTLSFIEKGNNKMIQ